MQMWRPFRFSVRNYKYKFIRNKYIKVFIIIMIVFCICLFFDTFKKKDYSDQQFEDILKSVEYYKELKLKIVQLLNKRIAESAVKFPQHIPILVIACNRITVNKPIDTLLELKSKFSKYQLFDFPIYVSCACNHKATLNVLSSYNDSITVLKPDYSLISASENHSSQSGYAHVARHYKWALDQIFLKLLYNAVIIVEDDLELAPDFLEYFAGTYPILAKHQDILFCISAFNDNGQSHLIDSTQNKLLYKTDFFSGLGWMLLDSFWFEIRDQWPGIYWDEYIRKSWVRKNRSCIRPEISRSFTFGKLGVSSGQYYDKYLRHIKLNDRPVQFTQMDLSYLNEPDFTNRWLRAVYEDATELTLDTVVTSVASTLSQSIRITYRSQQEFVTIARKLFLMDDFKSGVNRNAFRGVVPIFRNRKRIYIAPPRNWSGYNDTWV